MDYAQFVAKGRIVKTHEFYIDIEVNETRTVRLTGYNLKQYKVGHYAYCDGFLDRDKAYIINIRTFQREVEGQYEKYSVGGQDTIVSNAGIQKRSKDIQAKRIYPIYRANKKTD